MGTAAAILRLQQMSRPGRSAWSSGLAGTFDTPVRGAAPPGAARRRAPRAGFGTAHRRAAEVHRPGRRRLERAAALLHAARDLRQGSPPLGAPLEQDLPGIDADVAAALQIAAQARAAADGSGWAALARAGDLAALQAQDLV